MSACWSWWRCWTERGRCDGDVVHAKGGPLARGERGRPGWPAQAVDVAGLVRTHTVVDLGAGTGKLTRLLATRFDRVIAVEPADPTRRILGALCPAVEAIAGAAHAIPVAAASVDAIFAAQALHWFTDDRSIAEMTRILRPGAPSS